MNMFRNILLYIDPETPVGPALIYAERFAREFQGRLTLVDVVSNRGSSWNGMLPERWRRSYVDPEARARSLDSLLRQLAHAGLDVCGKLLVGDARDELVRLVSQGAFDIVFKTAGCIEPVSARGSIAVRLLRDCPCPVCIVDPEEDSQLNRIVVAVDPGAMEPERQQLSQQALDIALELTRLDAGEVQVVHAWRAYADSVVSVRMSDEQVGEYHRLSEQHARQRLRAFMEPYLYRLAPEQVHLIEGDPERVVPDFAARQSSDLLIMGTVARRGLPAAMVGNKAETVLQRSRCSILTIKPARFTSEIPT